QRERARGAPVEGAVEAQDRALAALVAVQARELQRGLVRLGARVREEHAALVAGLGEALEARREFELLRRGEVVRHVREALGLLRDGLHEHRVGVTEGVHGDAAEEIEEAIALGVPYVGALAAFEVREASAEAHEVACGLVLPVVRHDAETSVPSPTLVQRSTRTECGTRPSMIDAFFTPCFTASRQACMFGIMPDSSRGMSSVSSSAVRWDTRESRFGQSAYSPGTSVRMTSFLAPSARASALAAASALMLSVCPGLSRSGATPATTGIRSARRWSRTGCGSTFTTLPTRPRLSSTPS